MNTNFTTINTPKHFVTLGRPAGKRFIKSQFDDNAKQISDRLQRSLNISSSNYHVVRSSLSRNDFGDMDILVSKASLTNLGTNWQQKFLNSVFGENFYAKVPDTNTTVFEYKGFQINIHEWEGSISQAAIFLQNEGQGTLMQIIAQSLGMEYNVNGLYLKTGIEEQPLINVNTDPVYVYRMLGVSSDSLNHYVYTFKDLFKVIAQSTYFNRAHFLSVESDTERLVKNPILADFIKFLKAVNLTPGERSYDTTLEAASKQMYLNFQSYAPNTIDLYKDLVKRSKIGLLAKDKFNAEKVAEVTELSGEVLAGFIDSFKKTFSDPKKFEMFVITSLPETINKAMLKHRDATIKPEDIGVKPVVEVVAVEVVSEIPKDVPLPEVAKVEEVITPKSKPRGKKAAPTLEGIPKAKKAAPKKKVAKVLEEPVMATLPPTWVETWPAQAPRNTNVIS